MKFNVKIYFHHQDKNTPPPGTSCNQESDRCLSVSLLYQVL